MTRHRPFRSKSSTEEEARPVRAIIRRIVRSAFMLMFSLVCSLVLLEIIGRIVDPVGISYYPETARYLDTMIKEEPIGYRNRPNLKGRFHGATYTINSVGLRNPEIPTERPPTERRILMLGDSRAFGIGVEDDQCIPRVLERLANEHRSSETTYRVINMGVPSYNTFQQSVQLKTLGMSLDPDAVVLYYDRNDIEPKMWVFDKRSSLFADLAQRSYAACIVFVLRRQLLTAAGQESNLIQDDAYVKGNPRWQEIDQSLTEINRICRDAKIPFVLLVPGAIDEAPYPLHREVAEREGFSILSLDRRDDPRWNQLDERDLRNSDIDVHSNQKGCLIVATKMHELLLEEGLFGE